MSESSTIYLDHAATTAIDPRVLAVMLPYFSSEFYNPSAQYDAARSVKKRIEEARAVVAHYLGSRPSEIIFTAGGTESNNLAIHGILQRYPGGHMIVSAIEHDSVLAPSHHYDTSVITVGADGRVDMQALKDAIKDTTVLVSVQYVNNEIGTIQPLSDIAQIIAEVRKYRRSNGIQLPIYFHSDACQAPAYLDIHTARLGVDLLTINASKIYGPKQIGALYVKGGILLQPQVQGGGQERGSRSGTENVPSIVGFAEALRLVQDDRKNETARVQKLQSLFRDLLLVLPHIGSINGSRTHIIANNVHVTIPGYDNETLMMQLDDSGIICAVGSACSASNEEPSHVLKAIGLSDADAQASLRFTMGHDTSEDDIKRVVATLLQLLG